MTVKIMGNKLVEFCQHQLETPKRVESHTQGFVQIIGFLFFACFTAFSCIIKRAGMGNSSSILFIRSGFWLRKRIEGLNTHEEAMAMSRC